MNKHLRALILCVGILLQSCTSIRAKLVEWFGETKPVAAIKDSYSGDDAALKTVDFEPEFTSLDLQRKKIGIKLKAVASGFTLTTDIQFIPQKNDEALIALKSGELFWYNFNLKKRQLLQHFPVASSSELGLLGIAFHPEFPLQPKVYIHLNPAEKENPYESQILEYTWADREGVYSLESRRLLLKLSQPYANHNGGQIQFGPDGMLYIAFGDGGWRDDPHANGQNLKSWLGKILRIDVRATASHPYTIPHDNPFLNQSNKALPEIWAYGLRNPWRFSFSPDGRLIVADVGQNTLEEVSVVRGGDNLGWKIWEGTSCFDGAKECRSLKTKKPFITYGREDGMSITGGVVVENSSVTELNGKYVFADFVEGRLWAIDLPDQEHEEASRPASEMIALGKFQMQFSCFAKSVKGMLLVADFGSGHIFEIVSSAL